MEPRPTALVVQGALTMVQELKLVVVLV